MSRAPLRIRAFQSGDEHACERILRALPDWFGIEESLRRYVEDTKRYPTILAADGDEPSGDEDTATEGPATTSQGGPAGGQFEGG